MLGLSDFLNLQEQNVAARILKPWWDIFADYIIRVLLLISVVTGAVTLYVKDIVCIPAITCPVAAAPSQNPLLQKTCAAFYVTNRYLSNISDSETTVIITEFPDRSLNLYVNAECKRLTMTWFSMFFPFVLFYQAGACLILHNIWLTLSTSTTDQFSTLVHESCDSSDGTLTKTGQRETKTGIQVEELQKVVAEFVSDAWNLAYIRRKVTEVIDGRPWNGAELHEKVARFAKELKSKSFGCFRIRHIYAIELVFQFASLAIFLVLDLTWERNAGNFKCNIHEAVHGFVLQDHFICSYSHSSFYRWSLVGFVVCLGLHLLVNIRRTVWFFNEGYCGFSHDNLRQDSVAAGDFAFLLNLLRTSNPIFLDPINKMLLISEKVAVQVDDGIL